MKGEGLFKRYTSGRQDSYRFSRPDSQVLRFFLRYLRPHCLSLSAAVASTLLVACCAVAGPVLLMKGIDRYIAGGDLHGLTMITLFYLVVSGASWMGSYGQSYLAGAVGERVVAQIRLDFFSHLERMPLAFYEKRQTGEIMSRLTHDVDTLSELISTGLVEFIGDLLVIAAITGVMLALNTPLALLTLTVIPFILIITCFFHAKMRAAFREVRVKTADLNAELQENIDAVKVVQSMFRQEFNMEQFETVNRGNLRANLRAMGIFALFFPVIGLTGNACIALILWYGGHQVAGDAITLGLLVAFLQYAQRFFRPLRELSQVFNVFQSATAALDRIYEYMYAVAGMPEPATARVPPCGFKGGVEFRRVSFAYVKNRPVLRDFSLRVEPGATVALLGHSGAGKTTVLNLLARLYEAQEGQVLIDGVDVREIASNRLRKIMAVVPQEPVLFYTTVMENIRYGNPSATDDMIIDAAGSLGLYEMFSRLPAGFQTRVGRRGECLSGGQGQAVALIRALLANPLILVLDEATSNLDSLTEAVVKQALVRLLQCRTGIIITHRYALAELAEQIMILKGGVVAASGRHEQVYGQSELYKRLYECSQ